MNQNIHFRDGLVIVWRKIYALQREHRSDVEENGKLFLFEFNLKYLVFYPLDIVSDLRKVPEIVYFDVDSISKNTSAAFSAIVLDRHQDNDNAKNAFSILFAKPVAR